VRRIPVVEVEIEVLPVRVLVFDQVELPEAVPFLEAEVKRRRKSSSSSTRSRVGKRQALGMTARYVLLSEG
jgi:hypothetical protein